MKKVIIYVTVAAMLFVTAACHARDIVTNAENGQAFQPAANTNALSPVDTVKRFFECFNERDSEALRDLLAQGHDMALSRQESAILTLLSCEELQSGEHTAVVETHFSVSLDERKQSSFEEGEYTWRFELEKDDEGLWHIADYGA